MTYSDNDLKDGIYVSMKPKFALGFSGLVNFVENTLHERYTTIPFYQLSEMHCTLIYSRGQSPSAAVCSSLNDSKLELPGRIVDAEMYAGHDNDGYLVINILSKAMQERHKEWLDAGAGHSFPDYKCHITLASKFDIDSKEAKTCLLAIKNYVKLKSPAVTFYKETFEPIKK